MPEADSETGGDGDTNSDPAGGGPNGPGGQAPPEVELGLYQINVRVRGTNDDDLDAVEETACGLVEHLVEQAKELEDEPDGRGLG
jgi:hypothetical protein